MNRPAVDFDTIILKYGGHSAESGEMCLLEAVAYIAGEPWSDRPECVCPVLAAFGRSWNDTLPDDATRTKLLAPFIPKLIGTRSTPDVQDTRAFMAADWAVRVFTPVWLRKAGLDDDALALEQLPEMTSVDLCEAAMPVIGKARASAEAAWYAAGAAARYAAVAAAGAAAGAAAEAAAWDAARYAAGAAAVAAARAAARYAAVAAAWDAARAAAWDAAVAAAWDAAEAALADTVTELQQSALVLYQRMIDVEVAA